MPKPCYFEFTAQDTQRARDFYSNVFGWKFVKYEMPMDYWMIDTGAGEQDPSVLIGLGFMKQMSPEHKAVMYIDVDDIDAYTTKVTQHGGKLVGEKVTLEDFGWFQMFLDTENTMVALWQKAKK